MGQRKTWQLFLIIAVIALTLYNILPTVLFYTKPLKEPIDAVAAEDISKSIAKRANALEQEALDWLANDCRYLKLSTKKIAFHPQDHQLIEVQFTSPQDAAQFLSYLPRSGSMIPFIPAQLGLAQGTGEDPSSVWVKRQYGFHFDEQNPQADFSFLEKRHADGSITTGYRELLTRRVAHLATVVGGTSEAARQLAWALDYPKDQVTDAILLELAEKISYYDNAFGSQSPITRRFYASFSQYASPSPRDLVAELETRLIGLAKKLAEQSQQLKHEQGVLSKEGRFLATEQQEQLNSLSFQSEQIAKALAIVQSRRGDFKSQSTPLLLSNVQEQLLASPLSSQGVTQISLDGRNPFIESLILDWDRDQLELKLYEDVAVLRNTVDLSEAAALQREQINRVLFNEIARISREADESIKPQLTDFLLPLSSLKDSGSLLCLELSQIAKQMAESIQEVIKSDWHPSHPDLQAGVFPVLTYREFSALPSDQQAFALVIYAPVLEEEPSLEGLHPDSIYVLARGVGKILDSYQQTPDAPEAREFLKSFHELYVLLQDRGFLGYAASSYGLAPKFAKDFIFEQSRYYEDVLAATREDFSVWGDRRTAVLELTDYEQRLLTENRIDTLQHEDLQKWQDLYLAAQVSLDPLESKLVPPPTHSVFWDNFKLSTVKYFRGDDRKILKWGLDLSGGKTVRLMLSDRSGQIVKDPHVLTEGLNELTRRVNKMGLSEVEIRVEGQTLTLNFPGSQGVSASELIKAASMSFHLINEKFSPEYSPFKEAVNSFLTEVWNEAVVTGRTDKENLNILAWEHLGGGLEGGGSGRPRSPAAKLLYENGLRFLAPSAGVPPSGAFDDSLSSIAIWDDEVQSKATNRPHPLVIILRNFALEGANLENVQPGYDPAKGNILTFGVKSTSISADGEKINPRDQFYTWTSQYAEDTIQGTPRGEVTNGRGWRMAVILNDSVISAPALSSALRDHAMITGRFSQREVNQLAADLKAGSLTYTPKIISEQNVSPELGKSERQQGITAAVLGLALVIVAMVSYYRFGGIVASIAVLFNLLIMWGVLQNLEAAMTLPGIAAIILTMGMAVDANVLVFERIREEFAISKRLAASLQAGYRKAFTAIIDSNLTTIMAAIILMQFDSGPIKAFAVTLIVGIVSSMFTALFMTRFFFAGWVTKTSCKELKMASFFTKPNCNFLRYFKPAMMLAIAICLAGGFLLVQERKTVFGMDFTGGYALTVDLKEDPSLDYRTAVAHALSAGGALPGEFLVRELGRPNLLRLQLGISMEQPGHPFFDLPSELADEQFAFAFERNPRIVWVVETLHHAGLHVRDADLERLDSSWTEMSGQFSDTMRDNALLAMGLALVGILLYITLRFEFKYAISATLSTLHDVLVTLGVIALLHYFGVGLQINFQVIAAMMTIMGYSLNDTIIVFDRVREDCRLHHKMPFKDLVNQALNATLSRTVMTVGTTILVLVALVAFGGNAIFDFSLVMLIGVIVGTFSSLYLAAPLLVYFHDREETKGRQK